MSGEIFGEYIYRIECGDMDDSGVIPIFTEASSTPIVRCRDCKYYDDCDAGCSYFALAECKLLHIKNPDGFCAWGERNA